MDDLQPADGEMLVRVQSRTDVRKPFVAGIIYDKAKDRVTRSAPILRPLLGLTAAGLREDARMNGWKLTIVNEKARQERS